MFSLRLECRCDEKDLLVAELAEIGTEGIFEEDLPEERCRLEAFFDQHVDASSVARRFAQWGASVTTTESRDWVEASRAQWEPLLVGERFLLTPAWHSEPAPPGRIRLETPPGLAAGTGLHPSTQLALAALERFVRPGDSVLDLGCGSGILSRAAILLGAGKVIACDIDSEAAAVARDFLGEVPVFAGSVRSLRSGSFSLVAANINAVTLLSLAGDIARVLSPDGRAILTGFPSQQSSEVQKKLGKLNMAVMETSDKDSLVCLVAARSRTSDFLLA